MSQRGMKNVYHAKQGRIKKTKDRKPASHVQEDHTKEKLGKPNAKNARKGGTVMNNIEKPRTAALSPARLVPTTRKPVNTMKLPVFRAERERTNRVKGSQSAYHVKKVYTKEQSGKRTAKNAVQVDIVTVP